MNKFAIIVAGGSGTRMKSALPKQFLLLRGKPVLQHTLERFYNYDPSIKIILVLPENYFSLWKKLCRKYKLTVPHSLVAGGNQRFFSVKNALDTIDEKGIIAVHDGVRPFVSIATIDSCFKLAAEKGNAIPVIPVNESLRKVTNKTNKAVNRSDFCIVQTPQCFRYDILKKAYSREFKKEFTDDASVVEQSGKKIFLTAGNPENIKITNPNDLTLAGCLLKKQN